MMKTYSRKKCDEPDEVILDLNELCRLCMNKEDALVPIFNEQESTPLTLRIMACVSLEVFEGDGLPDQICHPCKYQLEKSYLFRKKCEMSDLKLRQHLRELRIRQESARQSGEDSEDNKDDVTVNARTDDDIDDIPQVSYIQPGDPETADYDPENITLSTGETDDVNNRDACTLPLISDTLELKRENVDADYPEEEDNPDLNCDKDVDKNISTSNNGMSSNSLFVLNETPQQLRPEDPVLLVTRDNDQQQVIALESQDLDVIAEAVRNTLASHPHIDCRGEIQMKIDQEPGKPTQVQVTTEDGSVIIMELHSEDLHPANHGIVLDEAVDEDVKDVRLLQHAETNDENGELKVFQCPECSRSFARRIQLRRHASVHMQQRGFSCGICEKWFPTKSALIRHERIHTGERPFQCDVCQKSFAQKEILYRHMMTHTGQKPYNCPHCPRGFTQKEPLRVHLKTHLNANTTDVQLHYCTLCPKVFCHASGLSRHLVTHTGKTFKCRECDKSFTDKSSLKRHHRQTLHQ